MIKSWRTRYYLEVYGPWVTFACTMALVAWLATGRHGPAPVTGFAQADSLSIAPSERARVKSLAVEADQEVEEGQVIAIMDGSAIDAELAIAEAERAEIRARVTASEAGAHRDRTTDLADLDDAVERARVALSQEDQAYQRAKAEHDALGSEKTRLQALVAQGLATREDLSRIEIRDAAITQDVAEEPETIRILRDRLQAAIARRDALVEVANGDVAVQPLLRQLDVLERRVAWLEHRRGDCVLRAPATGRITTIYKRPGETAAPESPVISMVRARADRVGACVSEQDALAVEVGDSARLWPRGGSGGPLAGRVISLGPIVDEVPVRCRRVASQPAWGRNVVVLLDGVADVVPGQAFDVSFQAVTSDDGSALAAESGGEPRAMRVPDALARMSRFEPSGAVWQPDRSRFVVVSDDTGTQDNADHAPWLFAMNLDGQVDERPLLVRGIGELNDLESIAAADDGSVYLLASQGYSRKGKRPASRTAFLRVRPAADGYEVAGEIHLVDSLEAAGAPVLARLGLADGTRALEIEGMAVRNGALYLGLKAPLDASGRAMIWRLDDAGAAFDAGRVDVSRLTLWGTVALEAEAGGQRVPGGISDLLFLPDQTLVIAATPSQGDAGDESGGLWYVSDPRGGTLDARPFKSFAGLRPEGLANSPSPGRMVVVFDTGAATPRWADLPWPR